MNPPVGDPGESDSPRHDPHCGDTDLKFVAVDLGDMTAGGWYRELPDAQIEVLSRAQLERVPLAEADAETTARETITEILNRQLPSTDPT